jgi:hypothetical protein
MCWALVRDTAGTSACSANCAHAALAASNVIELMFEQ